MDPVFYIMIGGLLLALFLFLVLRQQAQTQGGVSDRTNVVSRELYDAIHARNEALQAGISAKEQELRDAHAQLAAREQQIFHL